MIKCSIEHCSRPLLARGFCNAHYIQIIRKNKPIADIKPRREVCSICANKHYGHGFCKQHYLRSLRKERWEYFIKLKGGKCQNCNISFPYQVYDFHHPDPKAKEFSIGNKITNFSLEMIAKEIDKCLLLCSNCHRNLHASS